MKIQFDKVGHSAKAFHVEVKGAVMDGTLQKSAHHRIAMQGRIEGSVEVNCNRCGASFKRLFDIPLELSISDRIVESKDDLDIIEFLDGVIDMSYILQSEINTIKSEYHYCDACQKSEEVFEMEF